MGLTRPGKHNILKNIAAMPKKQGEGYRKKICLQSKMDIERMRVV